MGFPVVTCLHGGIEIFVLFGNNTPVFAYGVRQIYNMVSQLFFKNNLSITALNGKSWNVRSVWLIFLIYHARGVEISAEQIFFP